MQKGDDGMPMLREGSTGSVVRDLQIKLRALGHYDGDVDGLFGPITHRAVIAFQEDYEWLTIDGIVGPQTSGALD